MVVLSLTTDFGLTDGFVGAMKGVIYAIAPQVRIVDISHLVSPQNVREGAFTLWRAAPYFPAGSIHVAVVDPGVGTQRRPLAARLGDQYFVAPDNGILTRLLEDAEQERAPVEFVHLDNPKYWLRDVSRTFHGRDIFAPCGAHLAAGTPLSDLGTKITDPVRLELPRPEQTSSGWRANVTMIDRFGNIATNLPAQALEGRTKVLVRLLGQEVQGLVDSYGSSRPGELVALVDSEGYLEIAQVNGDAAGALGARIDDPVEVVFGNGGL
jgi:S-adenosylmethionine hydrolase